MDTSSNQPEWTMQADEDLVIQEILKRYLAGTLQFELEWKRD